MNKKNVKFEYDREMDAAYLTLVRGKVHESEEIKPGVIVDFDTSGHVIGVEILRFARRFLQQASAKNPVSKPLRKSA